jgi:hypothetical protein
VTKMIFNFFFLIMVNTAGVSTLAFFIDNQLVTFFIKKNLVISQKFS